MSNTETSTPLAENTEFLLKVARTLCERHGWDWANEYGEPGYGCSLKEVSTVILGDYWRRQGGELQHLEERYPRLWRAFEEAGITFEWHDEWMVDHETGKAWRTSADSYMWQPSIIFVPSWGDWMTPDHDVETIIETALDDDLALTSALISAHDLRMAGFTEYDGPYDSGFHRGMDDDPRKVIAELRRQHGADTEVLVHVASTEQFSTRWNVFYRIES